MRIACIVEGDGEVAALPVLLRRLAEWRTPLLYADVPTPIRVRRDKFLKRDDEFSRHMQLAAAKCGEDGWILILLDADDDCPASTGADILQRAKNCAPHRSISVVLANREYEAWFIAAAESLHGCRGFQFAPGESIEPEAPRNAKGWVKERMVGNAYGETADQAALTHKMDLQQVFDGCRSFRKLCSEWDRQVSQSL